MRQRMLAAPLTKQGTQQPFTNAPCHAASRWWSNSGWVDVIPWDIMLLAKADYALACTADEAQPSRYLSGGVALLSKMLRGQRVYKVEQGLHCSKHLMTGKSNCLSVLTAANLSLRANPE